MKLPGAVLCLALCAFFPLPGQQGLSLLGEATAAPATLTPEQVYWNCRREVFVKHGRAAMHYGRPDRVMYPHIATQMVDECVLRYRLRAARAPT
jgi:hypothetical protein